MIKLVSYDLKKIIRLHAACKDSIFIIFTLIIWLKAVKAVKAITPGWIPMVFALVIFVHKFHGIFLTLKPGSCCLDTSDFHAFNVPVAFKQS